jgi:hypothetical protein
MSAFHEVAFLNHGQEVHAMRQSQRVKDCSILNEVNVQPREYIEVIGGSACHKHFQGLHS